MQITESRATIYEYIIYIILEGVGGVSTCLE